MNCVAVRGRLAESSLGVLPGKDATTIERHLQWCAACRKEAGELDRAAATLAFSVAPAEPPADLEDHVVASVRGAAGIADRPAPRRARLAAVAMIAAMVALSGLGWGAVMAGKAARSEEAATRATLEKQASFEGLTRLFHQLEFSDPASQAFTGNLVPVAPSITSGGGSAITLVSPSIRGMAVVIVEGLPPALKPTLPYSVWLEDGSGHVLPVGRITSLDAGGGANVARDDVKRDLSAYDHVVVIDAKGRVLLRGTLATEAPVGSPSP